ncbi:MAG: hypothetical protein ACHQNT_00275 [Bacteroidia bacterium]
MKNNYYLFLLFMLFVSCTYRKKEIVIEECPVKITYENSVKAIIDLHCAISGCHVSGFVIGDYTTYAGIKAKVDNGTFRFRIFETGSMPPAPQPPLSEEELTTLKCWLDQGANEN